MKKLISVPLLALVLTACEDTSDDTIPIEINTPPTLSGTLSINSKALETASLVVDLYDQQGDEISATIINQPQWITVSTENNQATFNINPSLFEVNNHTFTVEISDGQASNQYQLFVNVAENREAWQPIELTNSEIMGSWHTANQDILISFANEERGVLFNDNILSSFYWSNPDVITLSTQFVPNCIGDGCAQRELIEIDVLAKRDDAIRVEFFNVTEDKGEVVTLYKDIPSAISSGYYTNHSISSYKIVSHLNAQNEESFFETQIAISLPMYDSAGTTTDTEYVDFSAVLQGTRLTINSAKTVATIDKLQKNNEGNTFNAQFDVNLEHADVVAQFNEFLVLKLSHSLSYHDDLTANNILETPELLAAMDTQESIFAVRVIKPMAVPTLETGKRYTGRLIQGQVDTGEGLAIRYVPSSFLVSANDNATVSFDNPKTGETFNWHLSLDNNGETIKVSGNGEESTLHFFELFDGQTIVAHARKKEQRHTMLGYPLLEVIDEEEVTLADYKHFFNYLREDYNSGYSSAYWYLNDDNTGSFLSFAQNGLTNSSSLEPNTYWQFEEDNSITFAMMSNCPEATDFTTCKTSILANETGTYLSLINFKLLHKDGNNYLLDRLFWQRVYDYSESTYKENIYQNSYWLGKS